MRQWAIAIGINQYQCFQPLSFAQRDAQALRNVLVNEVGVPPEQCLLMTDTSPPVWGKPTYPSRENIQGWIERLGQQYLEPGDVLWYFFSGYGVCYQGQDYLVPIEGNPHTLPDSSIPFTSLFQGLQAMPTESKLVLLDMSRSQSVLSHETVGTQTEQIANHTGIPTILSCQPGQFSRETAALGHGFFTAALLEGLRSFRAATLEDLDRYLHDRLPELSEHYWRPIQQPRIVSPPDKIHQVILPGVTPQPSDYNPLDSEHPTSFQQRDSFATSGSIANRFDTTGFQTNVAADGVEGEAFRGTRTGPTSTSLPATAEAPLPQPPSGQAMRPNEFVQVSSNGFTAGQFMGSNTSPQHQDDRVPQVPPPPSVPASPLSPEQVAPEISDQQFWRPLLLWGGLAVGLLFIGVLLRHWKAMNPQPTAQTDPPSVATLSPQPDPNNATARVAATNKPGTDRPGSNSQAAPVPGPSTSTSRQPAPPQPSTPATPLVAARAKALLPNAQAKPFREAIEEASKIQPGQPQYEEAQQEIAVWSRNILDIAKQHASRKNFVSAIRAASWVPQSQPIAAEARQSISQWCPAVIGVPATTQDLLQARTVCLQQK